MLYTPKHTHSFQLTRVELPPVTACTCAAQCRALTVALQSRHTTLQPKTLSAGYSLNAGLFALALSFGCLGWDVDLWAHASHQIKQPASLKPVATNASPPC